MSNVTTLRPQAETAARSIQRQDLAHASLDLAEAHALLSLPPGVRDIYRRLSAHIDQEVANANAILGRAE